MNQKILYIALLLPAWLGCSVAAAQIVDDSTRQVYGPHTTRVLYEEDILRGRYTEKFLDTSITNIQSQRYWFRDTTFQQTLGNIGTPARPLLFRFPDRIGTRFGIDIFDLYAYDNQPLTYFDTRSPYSHLHYIQGSRGEQVFEAKYSRNVKSWWNVGVAYNRLSANKQYGVERADDGQLDHNSVVFFTHLQSTNGRYHLFANFNHLNHEFVESGGVRPEPGDTRADLFDYETEAVNLTQATNREFRNNWHLFQVYRLANENLKVYHRFDRYKQKNRYHDRALPYNSNGTDQVLLFYPRVLQDSVRTLYQPVYEEFENTVGLTGNNKLLVYNVYAKHRDARVTGLVPEKITRGQFFLGGDAQLRWRDLVDVNVSGEYKLADEYLLSASAKLAYVGYRQSRASYSPTLVQQQLENNHFSWRNDFDNIVADQSAFFLTGSRWNNTLKAELAYTNLQRYVYFNQQAEPEQAGTQQRLFTLTLHHHFNWRALHLDHTFAYTNTSRADLIRIPEWLINSKIYVQGHVFKNALFAQAGVETFAHERYYGYAYMPPIQQFYLQDNFILKRYPIVDVFINADIKSVSLFVKMAHVNDFLNRTSERSPRKGYFATPYYPGLRSSFTFGLKWMFFT